MRLFTFNPFGVGLSGGNLPLYSFQRYLGKISGDISEFDSEFETLNMNFIGGYVMLTGVRVWFLNVICTVHNNEKDLTNSFI